MALMGRQITELGRTAAWAATFAALTASPQKRRLEQNTNNTRDAHDGYPRRGMAARLARHRALRARPQGRLPQRAGMRLPGRPRHGDLGLDARPRFSVGTAGKPHDVPDVRLAPRAVLFQPPGAPHEQAARRILEERHWARDLIRQKRRERS
jgi:hypothetical protein